MMLVEMPTVCQVRPWLSLLSIITREKASAALYAAAFPDRVLVAQYVQAKELEDLRVQLAAATRTESRRIKERMAELEGRKNAFRRQQAQLALAHAARSASGASQL